LLNLMRMGWSGSETPVFYSVAHRTLRGFLRYASFSLGHPLVTAKELRKPSSS